MNFIIGDIHGEFNKLKKLVSNIISSDNDPTLIFIGDYTNKGEDPYNTLIFLLELNNKYKCIFLRGNHEYMWQKLQNNKGKDAEDLLKYGALNTTLSINKDHNLLETKTYIEEKFSIILNNLKNYYECDNFIITHSGIKPDQYNTPINNIAAEDFLFNRYDFISLEKLYFNKRVIFGHTGFYSPFYDGFKIGIDTAACYLEAQPLTAFCTSEDFFINSANIITPLSSINKSFCPAIPRVKAWRQK
ncbi:MAG: putative phosphohydrolase [Bacteroidetes bacterium]|jgi:serine/threonine protein phosphatase 1|nr:putative phosphohydrolase [Bacteroidota bacterium]